MVWYHVYLIELCVRSKLKKLHKEGAFKETADGDSSTNRLDVEVIPAARSLPDTGACQLQAEGARYRGCAPREFQSMGIHDSYKSLSIEPIQISAPTTKTLILSELVISLGKGVQVQEEAPERPKRARDCEIESSSASVIFNEQSPPVSVIFDEIEAQSPSRTPLEGHAKQIVPHRLMDMHPSLKHVEDMHVVTGIGERQQMSEDRVGKEGLGGDDHPLLFKHPCLRLPPQPNKVGSRIGEVEHILEDRGFDKEKVSTDQHPPFVAAAAADSD